MRASWLVVLGLVSAPALAADLGLRPLFVGEVDWRQHGSAVEGFDNVALARLRLGVIAQPVPWMTAIGAAEWAQEKPALVDAYLAVRPGKGLRLSMGYAKTPLFISAHDESIEALPIPELSLVAQSFWPRRDLGLEAQWTPEGLPLETWVRVGNGSRSPLGNDNNQPALDARVDGRWGRSRGDAAASWGLRAGAGVHVERAFDRPGIGGTGPQGFTFYRPPPVSGPRSVVEAHARVDVGAVRVLAEGAAAWERRARDTDGNPATPREALPTLRSQGASLEVSWVVLGQPRGDGQGWPLAREGAPSLSLDSVPEGAVEVAARVERLWLGRGAADVTRGGTTGGAVAVRWWTTSFLGVGLAGYLQHHDVAPLEEPAQRNSWLALARATVSFH
ncbi:hypothetical protein DRW03_32225 [Corallococcus sp. H22C18031201]|uniref:hypothetical protein n=1 Tax=Citreicoccus inhibens TaxID=2849499 RepID=UPI000E7397FE|nr:hypothetical protein [Citreicoccus inhibens]MBU8898051.1 hypothetical protein [Citreicoccus inhibens]RJS15756.1 hypothetical protein DRW03_32225 [Corallococcus sp. H22C18031201]